MFSRNKLFFSLLLFVLPLLATAQNTMRPTNWAIPVGGLYINNVYEIDKGVYRSEQPSSIAFDALEKFGISQVINLRSWHKDQQLAKGTQIEIIDVPMNAHNINDHDVILALSYIKSRKGMILFHCRHGSDRTGLIAAMYRIVFQNWDKEDAIDELINGGYGFHPIYTNIPKYIRHVDVDQIKNKLKLSLILQ